MKGYTKRRPLRRGLLLTVLTVALLTAAVTGAFSLYRAYCHRRELNAHPRLYTAEVENASRRFGVPVEMIYAVILTESGFRPDAVSHAGAIGLMQITPDTFDWLLTKTDDREGFDPADGCETVLTIPAVNIRFGVFFLSMLHEEFGSWEVALAAYNAGRTRVKNWLRDPAVSADGRSLNAIPIPETASYVVKVTAAAEVYRRLYAAS